LGGSSMILSARGRFVLSTDTTSRTYPAGQKINDERERGPGDPTGPGDRVRPQQDVGVAQRQNAHAGRGRPVEGQQPDAEPGDDQVLEEVEAVDPVRDARCEAGHRGEYPHDVLVGGVARVDD